MAYAGLIVLLLIPLALAATPSWSQSKRNAPHTDTQRTDTQGTVGSPLQSLPRSMRPHMRKSARRDQTG